ncbi:MAG: phenylalanine--tRNA ligase subunit beta, partial [Oscillospiraceae bacterium]|nr:phenylalanine--tRNA ligase subunit beta [Candidatus Equicaccousia limihippi]
KKYVDIDIPAPELAEKMVMVGFEVEEMTDLSATMDNVIVGKITKIEPHQDSDHLQICQVDVGGKSVQIVTGAQNVFEGATVPVAMDKSLLPDGTKITKGKLRGVESLGMLCSGGELGLSEGDFKNAGVNGIMIMDDRYTLGTDMREILGLNDYVIDFKITANRPDCQSVIGIAREAAAVLNKPFKLPETPVKEMGGNIDDFISVEVKNYDLCPRYMGAVVKNIKIAPSPAWLCDALKKSGMRPINNIVDITNFVMLETGQPMHAFDLRELEDNKIIVRNAAQGESIELLDGKVAELSPEMLVIADGKKPSCLAGVMGGAGSGIKDDTSAVFFECAKFVRDSIRKTAKAVGVRTESSARYEKGTDIKNVEYALNRALSLICELEAGEVVCGKVDNNLGIPDDRTLSVSVNKINALLGLTISGEKMKEILNSLLIKTELSGDTLTCLIPSFRSDIEFTADIAEEVIRLYGCDHIIGTALRSENTMGGYLPKLKLQRSLKKYMTALGLNEIYTYSFIAKGETEKLGLSADNAITILNPLGEEYSVMRTQLVSSMLRVISTNQSRGNEQGAYFEVSKRFIPKSLPLTAQPDELATVSIGLYGENEDFYTLKGVVEQTLEFLGCKEARFKSENLPAYMHPGRSAAVYEGDKLVAVLGEIHPLTLSAFDIPKKCLVAEIYLDLFENRQKSIEIYKPLPKYPAVTRDLALICARELPVGDMLDAIKSGAGKLLENAELFDVYTGEQIESDKKSVAFKLTLRSAESTLTDETVEKAV